MFNRFIKAGGQLGKKTANQSAAAALIVRDTFSGFMTTAHHTLMILGIIAISALALMFVKPDIADHLKALSPFALNVDDQPAPAENVKSAMDTPGKPFAQGPSSEQKNLAHATLASIEIKKAVLSPQQQTVAKWLSRRYRVAGDATRMLVAETYKVAEEIKLDPLLILAVAAIESGFNPFAESAMGAQGLMQVMSKVHHDKFKELGGIKAALNPVANLRVGALILKEYVRRAGSMEAGLKWYVGAAAMETDSGYGSRVLNEYRRLQQVAAGKVPASATVASTSKAAPKSPAGETAAAPKIATSDEGASAALEKQPGSTDRGNLQVVAL